MGWRLAADSTPRSGHDGTETDILNLSALSLLVVFNALISGWPMVAMNVVLAGINTFYVLPRYRDFMPGEFLYQPAGPFAARGFRRVIAPAAMLGAQEYLARVGFRPDGEAQVLELP